MGRDPTWISYFHRVRGMFKMSLRAAACPRHLVIGLGVHDWDKLFLGHIAV